jgi:hypothetical protein
MATPAAIGEAFRRLQGGDAAGALALARRIAAEEPGNSRAHLAMGIALRVAGSLDEACAALERAERLDPRDHAPAYEIGVVRQMQGRAEEALASFERSARARPEFFAAHFSAGLLLAQRREWERAAERFRAVLAIKPNLPDALLHLAVCLERLGRHPRRSPPTCTRSPPTRTTPRRCASSASTRPRAAISVGRHRSSARPPGWSRTMRPCPCSTPSRSSSSGDGRPPGARMRGASRGASSSPLPPRAARRTRYPPWRRSPVEASRCWASRGWATCSSSFAGRRACAPQVARLAFTGDTRLHSLLARTGHFEAFASEGTAPSGTAILVGDLPSMFAREDPTAVPSLSIAPLPERLDRWRATLAAAGPKPWIGAAWRAGTPRDVVAHALAKSVPVDRLFAALAPLGGTVFSLQRDPGPDEIDAAARSLAARVHDLAHANADLEDVLAVMSLLDRNATVSNTNLHLAAAAGATADVLVPWPPEWRWRLEGDSPWFAGFRVHRQSAEGDWTSALRDLGRATG